ncbi:platelet-activating factor acetylhydrolase [Alexandromys fortis]|uniref:platelet-activating factor acetylhydrolase n=1 Tax=Alexandromys fortis TaxID=100897 RepID=UPI0021526DB1|nr:platelet-activating factor acetylhydrolase [Microtus fortis]
MMAPPKLHILFCLFCCLPRVHPLHGQDPPPFDFRTPALFHKIQAMMSTASSGHSKIPKGNGSYPVGSADLMFGYTNESVFLRLYYPSEDQEPLDTVWIPNKEYFFGLSKFLGTPHFIGNFLNFLYGSMKTPASWNSPLKTGEKYPLIVFSHGLGGFSLIISRTLDMLSSHTALSRFKAPKVRQRAKECSRALSTILDLAYGNPKENVLDSGFDLKHLKGAIDGDKIAVIGHSFGGATVIQTLSEDQRFKCGIALDPWMHPVSEELRSKIPQPLFFINSAQFQSSKSIEKMKKFYEPGKERKMIIIRGSVHQNFPDFTFVIGKIIGKKLSLKGEIDSLVAMDLTEKASLAFLQKHLGLHKDFNQWDPLVEGHDKNLIPGPPSSVVAQSLALQHSPETHAQN